MIRTWPALLPSQSEMEAMDAATVAAGTSSVDLMERAGAAVVDTIAGKYPGPLGPVVVVCGSGHNGGDGYVVARLLRARGEEVEVFALPPGGSEVETKRATLGGTVHEFDGALETLKDVLSRSRLVIDALLGTGQKDAPRGVIADVVRLIQMAKRPFQVVALDLPTGLNADTGAVFDPCVQADLSISIECVKRGMLQYPARAQCGEIIAAPIGIKNERCEFSVLDRSTVGIRRRRPDCHKGSFGKVLVIGGSRDMPGAPWLSVNGALSAGSGLVVKAEFGVTGNCMVPEAVLRVFSSPEDERFTGSIRESDAVVVGPGLGAEADGVLDAVIGEVVRTGKCAVLDADALNYLARNSGRVLGDQCIITPHPGEAARLLGSNTAAVQSNRYQAARELAVRFECVAVLKGAATVVHNGRNGWVNTSGTPYLATPGSGDVLSGIIAGLAGQGLSPLKAALAGVFLHGRAGETASVRTGSTIRASDIALSLPAVLSELYED